MIASPQADSSRRVTGRRAWRVVAHGMVGAGAGYLVLHPAAMLAHHVFASGAHGALGAIALAFSVAHGTMAAFFVALGAIAGVLQGVYVQRLAVLNERLEQLSRTDELTGLYNRRQLLYLLAREVERARRDRTALSVALVDVDHFKRFNDEYGHAAGDALLRAVARIMPSALREVDVVARYGGDEFALVFPAARLDAARAIVARLRASVKDHRMVCRGVPPSATVTVSVGLAELGADRAGPADLLAAADAALYAAKRAGRDRTCAEGDREIDSAIRPRFAGVDVPSATRVRRDSSR